MKVFSILIAFAGAVLFSGCKKSSTELNPSLAYVGEKILVRKVFLNPSGTGTGYACGGVKGSAGGIYRTTDMGQSWTKVWDAGAEEIYDVFFANDSVGYACGDNLTMLKTTNSGSQWFRINSNPLFYKAPSYPLKRVFFTDALNGYMAGGEGFDLGITLRTVNGGLSWLYTTYPREMRDVYFSDSARGFVCGYGIVLNTGDGDKSTETCNVKGDFFTCMCATPNKTLFVAGYSGGIFRSTDSGANWVQVYSSGSNFNAIAYYSDQEVYVVGNNGIFVWTQDGGSTWKTLKSFTAANLYTVCVESYYSLATLRAGPTANLLIGSDQGNVYRIN